METVFFFKNMLPAEEGNLREYITGKLPKFEKVLNHLPPDGVVLHIKGEKFEKHSAYEVEFVLKMGKETLSAKEASHAITKAVDLAKDRLDMQLKRSITAGRRTHRSIKAKSKLALKTSELV